MSRSSITRGTLIGTADNASGHGAMTPLVVLHGILAPSLARSPDSDSWTAIVEKLDYCSANTHYTVRDVKSQQSVSLYEDSTHEFVLAFRYEAPSKSGSIKVKTLLRRISQIKIYRDRMEEDRDRVYLMRNPSTTLTDKITLIVDVLYTQPPSYCSSSSRKAQRSHAMKNTITNPSATAQLYQGLHQKALMVSFAIKVDRVVPNRLGITVGNSFPDLRAHRHHHHHNRTSREPRAHSSSNSHNVSETPRASQERGEHTNQAHNGTARVAAASRPSGHRHTSPSHNQHQYQQQQNPRHHVYDHSGSGERVFSVLPSIRYPFRASGESLLSPVSDSSSADGSFSGLNRVWHWNHYN